MDVIETTVHSKPERSVVAQQFLAAMSDGAQVIFSLVDKRGGKISGASRLQRDLQPGYSGMREYRGKTLFSNYFDSFTPATENDVHALIQGLGTRYPCEHGWVLVASSVPRFLAYLGHDSPPINQNCFLPGECKVFSFGVFGALVLETRHVEDDGSDDVRPLEKHAWHYLHFVISPDEARETDSSIQSISAELKQAYSLLDRSIKSKSKTPGTAAQQSRVTFSPIAKKHFSRLGYKWNKALSEPRITVFDKLMETGNIIRLSADAGGHSDLIPYVDAQFVSMAYRSPAVSVVSPEVVSSTDQLLFLLERHQSDLAFFEEQVAKRLDTVVRPMNQRCQRLLTQHDVRAIVQAE